MKKKLFLQLVVPLLSLCVLFFLLATDPMEESRSQDLVQLSVIFREEDPVWSTTRDGMEQAAADLGAELRFLAPASANDAREQETLLERELDAGAEGILLIPADRSILKEAVKKTGRVVVTLETAMEGTEGCVGVDNAAMGEAVARSALNGVRKGGTAVLLDSAPGDNGVRERLAAARVLLEQEGRHVMQVMPTMDKTVMERLAEIVEVSKPSAVLAFEPSVLEDAADLIRTIRSDPTRDWKSIPLLYGMGSTPAIAAGLEQGHITALHAQDDFSSGYIAVVTAVMAVRHQNTGEPEPLPFLLVRRENMYDEDRQKLMFPVCR